MINYFNILSADNLQYEQFPDGTVKCIEDEIPFDVPNGWAWTSINNIAFVTKLAGFEYTKNIAPNLCETGIPLFKGKNVQDSKIIYEFESYIPECVSDELLRSQINRKCILTPYVGTIGNIGIHNKSGKFHLGSNVGKIELFNTSAGLMEEYVVTYLKSNFGFKQLTKHMKATAQASISIEAIRDVYIPIPPEKEQQRLWLSLSEVLKQIENINTLSIDISNIITAAKSKILDLAIRGKLVPQNPNDEPASLLLERIRAEKEELINQGKIKRDKKESVIFKGEDNSYYEKIDGEIIDITEEIPFSIPENWCWCRLNTLCTKEIKRGKAPKYSEKSNTLVFAQKCNTKKGSINISLAQHLDENVLKKYPPEFFMKYNDIVINSTGTGTLGRVGIFEKSDDIYGLPLVPDSHITTIRVSELIVAKYIYALLKLKQPYLETAGEGSTNQKELRPDILSNILIPLPPVLEQKQIVDTINLINMKLDDIEHSLS